ncbi:23S rRNA (pseudouridine(1915)-N(3))-methyltransferase RlmH [Candidatus Saccharibacteria bacterium]|nr:23S rRNA (pseudouridine(1915)-N(3))-methyltransferase RlmH [Candidatus Saccharibacteria bacterium]
MSIRIIAIGKKHETWVSEGISRYQERLKKPFMVEWVFLPHSSNDGLKARQDESGRILNRLNDDDFVVLLDERGQNVDSIELSKLLKLPLDKSKSVVIVIGGAYGVDDNLTDRANFVWSLSNLVFPHQLVRLILVEQIYRVQEIAANRPYHHA